MVGLYSIKSRIRLDFVLIVQNPLVSGNKSQLSGLNVPALEVIVPPCKFPYTVTQLGLQDLLCRSDDVRILRTSFNVSESSTSLINHLLTSVRIKSRNPVGTSALEHRNANLLGIENLDFTHSNELFSTALGITKIVPSRIDCNTISILLVEEIQREPFVGLNSVASANTLDEVNIRRLFISAKLSLNTLTLDFLFSSDREVENVTNFHGETRERLGNSLQVIKRRHGLNRSCAGLVKFGHCTLNLYILCHFCFYLLLLGDFLGLSSQLKKINPAFAGLIQRALVTQPNWICDRQFYVCPSPPCQWNRGRACHPRNRSDGEWLHVPQRYHHRPEIPRVPVSWYRTYDSEVEHRSRSLPWDCPAPPWGQAFSWRLRWVPRWTLADLTWWQCTASCTSSCWSLLHDPRSWSYPSSEA